MSNEQVMEMEERKGIFSTILNNIQSDDDDIDNLEDWSKSNSRYGVGTNMDEDIYYVEGKGYCGSSKLSEIKEIFTNNIRLCLSLLVSYFVFRYLINGIILLSTTGHISFCDVITEKFTGSDGIVIQFIVAIFCSLVVIMQSRLTLKMPITVSGLRQPKHSSKILGLFIGMFVTVPVLITIISKVFSSIHICDDVTYSIYTNATLIGKPSESTFLICVIWVLLDSFLYEIILHTSLFTSLRQFGDYTAILCAAVGAVLVTNNIHYALVSFIVTFCTGLIACRTHSIATPIFGRIIFQLIMLLNHHLHYQIDGRGILIQLSILVVVAIVSAIACYILIGRKKEIKNLFNPVRKNVYKAVDMIFITSKSISCVILLLVATVFFLFGSLF